MRPFVFINIAMSADGKISTRQRRQVRLSGHDDFIRVDKIKAESDAIMVGIGTVLADNPSLTIKSSELKKIRTSHGMDENPIRVVVDSRARIPLDAEILHQGAGRRVVAVSDTADSTKIQKLHHVAEVVIVGHKAIDLEKLLDLLGDMGIKKVMVEGGGTLIEALFRLHLVDELYTYIGNTVIGGSTAPTLADGTGFIKESEFVKLKLIEVSTIDEGILIKWQVQN